MSQNIEYNVEDASFARRIIASTIDIIIITLIMIPVGVIFNFLMYDGRQLSDIISTFFNASGGNVDAGELWEFLRSRHIITKWLMMQFITASIIFGFLFWFWIKKDGATPGKMIARCRIVDAKTANSISTKQSIIRAFSYILSAIPFCIGFIMIDFNKRKRGIHDLIAGTVVIKEKKVQKT